MNHLLHTHLPADTVLELVPTEIQAGDLETPDGFKGYVIQAGDGDVTVRLTLSQEDFARFARGCAAKVDEDGVAESSGKIQVARTIPLNREQRRAAERAANGAG